MKVMDGNYIVVFRLLWMITTRHIIVSGENIALAKNTRQSTTFSTYGPERGVNGDLTEWIGAQFMCAHTRYEYQPWWVVDLGDTYNITNVIVYNRKDNTIGSARLKNYDIDVFAKPACFCDKWIEFTRGRKSMCHFQSSSVLFLNATCQEESIGRFVRIRLRNTEYLNICEVEVFGSLTSNRNVNSSSRKACGFPEKDYEGNILETTEARSNIECADTCVKTVGCCAGVYETITYTCLLMGRANTDEDTSHSLLDNSLRTSWLV